MSAHEAPEWLRLQRKILSRWVNQKLWMSRHIKVNDVIEDMASNPLVLISLVEVLSERKFSGKLEKVTKMRVQQIANMNMILKFIFDECGVQMKLRPSPEDLLDKNERNVLGLVFSIMMKFLKFGDEEGTSQVNAKEALMLWIQNKTNGYGLTISNFTTSFHSGLALCAIIHKHRPKLIDWDALDKASKTGNVQVAMDAAEKYFGLEQYITPAEFAKLDEPSMVVYVSEYYYGIAEQRKLDQAARRIHKVIKFTKACDKMRAEYAEHAKQFKERLTKVEKILEDRTIDNTMAGAKKKIEEFYDYKTNDKGAIIGLQLNLEGIYNHLSMLLSHNKRPEFVPPQGLALPDIDAAMQHLEQVEQERKVALHAELNRQIKLVQMDEHHTLIYNKLKAWIDVKVAYLQTKEQIDSVGAARFSLCTLDAFDSESKGVQSNTVVLLNKIGAELRDNKYEKQDDVDAREQFVLDSFNTMNQLSKDKRPVLEDDLARETFKDKTRVSASQHEDKYNKLSAWIAEKEAYLAVREPIGCVSDAQVQIALLDAYDASQSEMSTTSVVSLKNQGAEILAAKYETQYSSYVYEQPEAIQQREANVDEKWAALSQASQEKHQYLDQCLADEVKKEDLRVEFARCANDYTRWIKDHVENLSLALFGFNLEEVEAYAQELATSEQEIANENNEKQTAYINVWNEMQSMGVTENVYTSLTTDDLEALNQQLQTAIQERNQKYQTELETQRANDALCKQFADLADPLSQWIMSQKTEISGSRASLHEQLKYVDERIASIETEGASRADIDALQQQIDDAGVTNNRHTTLTAKDLNVQWKQYEAFLEKKKAMLETEIEHQERRGISADQFREIDDNWKLFDKSGKGLDLKTLKACLYSLGEELTQSEVVKVMTEYGASNIIPYQGYRQYMLHLFGDTDTKDEIVNGWVLIARGEDSITDERMGSVMEDEDVQYIHNTAPKVGAAYNYRAWTADVFSRQNITNINVWGDEIN